MANRKEYEMAFLLNAALNGNFKGTFSKAQQEFAKLGREIQDLQKLQANVSSYQKQEQAIASTTTKLSNLQQQSALLEQQIKATRDAENQDAAVVAALEREELKLEQRIKDTETALERQKQKLEATGQKLQDAGIDTKNLTDADARLTEQLKELHAQQDKAAESAQSFGAKTEQAFEAVSGAIAAAGITNALKEVGAAYMECVTIAGDFQEEMSNVEALSGATAENMANLTAQAEEIGADTKYPHIEMVLVLAYLDREIDTSRYDSTTYPPLEKVPPKYAIVKRNEWMICESEGFLLPWPSWLRGRLAFYPVSEVGAFISVKENQ